MKKFVRIQQMYTVKAIIDVQETDTEETLVEKIKSHCAFNGGAENVITCGGDITCKIIEDVLPTEEDEEDYECID